MITSRPATASAREPFVWPGSWSTRERRARPGWARRALACSLLFTLTSVAAAHAAVSPDSTSAHEPESVVREGWRTARISYLTGGSVYLEAGSAEGLATGDTAWIMRGGLRAAALRVVYLSTHRASCDTLWTKARLAVGDAVAYRPGAAQQTTQGAIDARADSLRAAAVVSPSSSRAASRDASLRGRIGARWLSIDAPGSSRLSQPAFEARFDGREGLGGHLDASLDVRGRRTLRTSESGRWVEQYSRVYRASATFRDVAGGRRLTLGRQSSPTLASVSLFDGALVEWNGSRAGVGTFAGTQPDPLRSRWSSDLLEAGAYAEIHQAPLAKERWSLAAGAVGSRHRNEVDREFVFAQGWWFSRAATASLAQEVDVNRGWKRAAGEPPLAWTSTFASLRVPVGARVALHSGYDNRRNVRLWRDRETLETQFDDRYRQGAWAGVSVNGNEYTSVGGEYRVGSGGERSEAWSVTGELHRLTAWHAVLRGRWASFTSDAAMSSLVSLAAGFDPWARSHVEISSGVRRTRDRLLEFDDHENWLGADADLALGARWYVNAGCERLTGPTGNALQVQAGVSVRL